MGKAFLRGILTGENQHQDSQLPHLVTFMSCRNMTIFPSGSSTVLSTVGIQPMCFDDNSGVVTWLCLNVRCGSIPGLVWSRVKDNPSDFGKERDEGAKGTEERGRGSGSKERNKRKDDCSGAAGGHPRDAYYFRRNEMKPDFTSPCPTPPKPPGFLLWGCPRALGSLWTESE